MTRRGRSRNPFRILRRRLAEVERNSATRPGSRWRRATEYALLLSLPIAILLTILLDDLGVTVDRDRSVRFRVGRDAVDGPATVVQHDAEQDHHPWSMTLPLGTVVVETRLVRRGWPIASVVERPPPRLLATLILAPEERVPLGDPAQMTAIEETTGVSLEGVDEAVLDALERTTSLSDLAATIRADRTETTRSWAASIAAGGATWMMLFLLAAVGIRMLQLVEWGRGRWRRRRIVRRLRSGRCPDCRYDLRSERFPKRCPECGRRIWS